MEESPTSRVVTRRLRGKLIGGGALALVLAASSAVAVATSVSPRSLSGAGVTSMTISGIAGEGAAGAPSGSIDVLSWSWGMSQRTAVAGAGSGKVNVQDLSIVKSIDKASPKLFQACITGATLQTLVLNVSPPGSSGTPGDTFTITLSGVHVMSDTKVGGPGDENPSESISMNYTKIQMDYYPQSGTTSIHGGWDLKSNKAA
jgi:type VI secretion system secreted protein Hcp